MGGAMLSKSLIQFSVDRALFPHYCLTWDQTMLEVIKIMATSFKRSCAPTATLSTPDHAVGHCWPTPPPETPGHSWASLGQSPVGSLLLSPESWCTQGFVCALLACSLEGLMLKLKLQYFGHLVWRTDSLEKTLMLAKIEGRRRREWQRMRWLDGITMQWTWVWASAGSWRWTGKPGVLQSMGLQRVRHVWATKLNWTGG